MNATNRSTGDVLATVARWGPTRHLLVRVDGEVASGLWLPHDEGACDQLARLDGGVELTELVSHPSLPVAVADLSDRSGQGVLLDRPYARTLDRCVTYGRADAEATWSVVRDLADLAATLHATGACLRGLGTDTVSVDDDGRAVFLGIDLAHAPEGPADTRWLTPAERAALAFDPGTVQADDSFDLGLLAVALLLGPVAATRLATAWDALCDPAATDIVPRWEARLREGLDPLPRLPAHERDLLRRMLALHSDERPSAAEVADTLLAGATGRATAAAWAARLTLRAGPAARGFKVGDRVAVQRWGPAPQAEAVVVAPPPCTRIVPLVARPRTGPPVSAAPEVLEAPPTRWFDAGGAEVVPYDQALTVLAPRLAPPLPPAPPEGGMWPVVAVVGGVAAVAVAAAGVAAWVVWGLVA